MRLDKYLKRQRVSGLFTFSMFAALSMNSTVAQAAFSDLAPSFTSSPYTCPANPNNPQDPANHKMFVVAVNPRPYEPKVTQDLIWSAGTETKDFVFAGNKILTITFDNLVDEVNANRNPFFGAGSGSGPANGTYNNGNENTDDAINTRHGRRATQNHVLNVSVNRNVSKIGYKIQDVDSQGPLIVRYQQEVEALDGGIFDNLSFNRTLQNINNSNNIISGKRAQTCGLGECVIDASWKYTPAKSPVRLKHRNLDDSPFADHIVGYSDFYFCLAPPKIIVNKTLVGSRVNDTENKRDQFEISIGNSASTVKIFTTSDKGSTIANGSSDVVSLVDGSSYTITERVMNGSTLGDIANYNATYTCNNATTGTSVTIPSEAMIYNLTTKTRSFSINNVGYGDEITCTITNTPATLTFSGTVFNDNGGIPDSQANALNANITSGIYANNPKYFDGEFNSTPPNAEAGIFGSFIDLTDCSGTTYKTQAVNADGTYSLKVTTVQTAGNTKVCLVERRNDNNFPVRTTKSNKPLTITADKDIYPDNNFGRVIAANSALVLTKYQHINDCSPNLKYTDIGTSSDPTYSPRDGFSTSSISDITPDECIAYKIVATNRANLPITNFVLRDVLQKKGVNNAMATAIRVGPTFNATDYATDSVAIGDNGIVKTNELNLSKKSTREFYFNTKYQSAN
ncbi:hypothetical protein [Psychrobacter faecalis]|uniref:hypothetical protein n=1 Tax=Psychrobacter faecalis TaxID=180588 RepID=UPI0018DF9452|nr:hypothetical protein [Psychrobacter faecalis]